MFIFAGVIFLVSRRLAAIFRQRTAISQHATARLSPDKLNFPIYGFFTRTKFPPDQAAVYE
jgi:hypothetical protein